MQLKVQVLAIPPMETRKYAGRSWHQRQLQCIADQKVFVHNETASTEPNEEGEKERTALQNLKEGYYMTDLVLEQGDRGKAVFALRNWTPIKAQPGQPQT